MQMLAPILAELGWNPFGQDVIWEHPVGGKKGGRVDIALRADGRIWALIEAKVPGATLDQHVEQLLRYAFHEGVDVCALSDGLRWWLYAPRESGPPHERRFAVLTLGEGGDPVDQLCDDLNTFLGRESLLSKHAIHRAVQVLHALREAARLEKEVPRIWQQMLEEPDSNLIELIGQRVYEDLSLRPERDQIVAAMRNQPIPPRAAELNPDPSPSSTGDPSPSDSTKPRQRTVRPSAIRLWGEDHPVRYHKDVLLTVVAQLHRRHSDEFDEKVAPLKSGRSQYVARDLQQVRGTRVERTASGHHVNVNLSAATIKERTTALLEAFGHSESDLEYVYE